MIKLSKKTTEVPCYKLTLKADGNDADYVTTTEFFSESEFKDMQYYIYKLLELEGVRGGIDGMRKDVYRDYVFNHLTIPFYCDEYCHTLTSATLEYFYEDVVYDVEFTKRPDIADEVMQELLLRIQGGNEPLWAYVESMGLDELNMSELETIDDNYIHCPGCGWWVEVSEMVDDEHCADCYEEEE